MNFEVNIFAYFLLHELLAFVQRTLGTFFTRDRKYQTRLIIGFYDTNDKQAEIGPRRLALCVDHNCHE